MTRVLVINGPNLNLLGEREPGQYGQRSLQEILDDMSYVAEGCGVTLSHVQSNSEGDLIDAVQTAGRSTGQPVGHQFHPMIQYKFGEIH